MFNNLLGRVQCLAFLLALSMLSLSLPALAAKKVETITEIEGITEYRLKNGLTVLLFPDQTKETVTVNMTYKVGSKHESYGETGMAHLLEHLLFKGSKKHKDIPAELSSHGAKPNGTTWIDRTNYFETFSATEENIKWALDLEADRMVNSFIAQEDLDSEMTVVRNEFERTENSPVRVLMQRMNAVSYMWHNNGKPTIGARSDIENVSIKRLQAFYKKYYQPDNAVLIVAGKFNEKKMLKRINKRFGRIPKPKRTIEQPYTTEPAQSGELSVVVRRVGDIQWYGAAYHIPAGAHVDYAPVEVLSQVLGDTPRGRLHKQIVEKKLAVGSFAFSSQLNEPGLMFVLAKVDKEADLEKTRRALLSVIEDTERQPITDGEVDNAKRSLLKGYELAFNSSEQIAILLSEYIGMGDWRLLFLTRDRIEAVIGADVQRVSQSYLVRNNRTEGRFLPSESPERVSIPVVENLAGMLDGYKGREKIAQGEAFDPSFDNIQARTQPYTIANGTKDGAKGALLAKKTRGESVVLKLNLQFGTEASLMNQKTIAGVVGDMLMRGSKRYSREELQNKFDELKASVSVGGGVNGAYVSIDTTKTNLAETLKVVAEVLQEPVFDKKEFELLKERNLTGMEASRQEPRAIVSREMGRFYSPFPAGHPNYTPTLDESMSALKKVTLKDLNTFHKRFYGANNMQLSVVGDFDSKELTNAVDGAFKGWLSKEPYKRIEHPYQEIKTINKVIDTPDKESSAMVALLPIAIGENDEDAAALELGAYMFGGGFLNSRLATRLRGEDGLCYGVSAWLSLDSQESNGSLSAFAIFAPQNTAAVELGMKEELERVIKGGFTAEELIAAKSGMLQKARVNRAQNGHLAGSLVSNLFLGRAIQWDKAFEEKIEALTVADVNAAFKRHIKPAKVSFVKAGDASKAK